MIFLSKDISRHSPILFWIAALLLFKATSSSNILFIPYPFTSHIASMLSVGSGLQERGHTVSILLPESYPHLNDVKQKANLVTYTVKYADLYSSEEKMASWTEIAPTVTPIEEMRTFIDGYIEFCTNPLEDETLLEKLQNLKLHLAVVDGFPGVWCLYILMYKLKVPYVSLTTEYEAWMWRNPGLPSFVPFPLAGIYTEKMNFLERVQNLLTLVDWTAWPQVPYMEDSFIKRYLPEDDDTTYSKLTARSLLWLIDSDVTIDYARPTMANEIYIGGLSTRPAKPLSPDLEDFVGNANNGFIVVSFGSSGILEDEVYFGILISVLTRFEQRVVWKYSGNIPSDAKIPSNVKIMKWLPQNDLLGHKNCRLFVTHCGANGQFEALYHGVPMLGIPAFGDQPYNARRMQYFGYGRFLEIRHVRTDSLFSAMTEILSNSTYRDNIRRGSAIFRDRPQTPRERAVYWIEHVLRHGGQHLHSIALDLPWYEYLMLDLLFVLVILPVVVLTSLVSCCGVWILRRCLKSKKKAKTE